MRLQRRTRRVQQRAPQLAGGKVAAFAHGRQAIYAGASQGAQQEGFGLIVVVVGQRQPFAGAQQAGEGRMARVAGGGFGAEAGVIADLHVDDVQRHLPSIANTLAVRGPVVGGGLQAVVDVHGAKARMPVAGIGKQMQQHGRIQPAAEADQHRGSGGGVRQQGRRRIHRGIV